MRYVTIGLFFIAVASLPVSAQVIRHEVVEGETLFGIARRYGLSLDQLIAINEIESRELLLPGTVLTIGQRHTVERGDTLFSIARRYQTSVEALQQANDMTTPTIFVGQNLMIPKAGQVAAAAPQTPHDTERDVTATERDNGREGADDAVVRVPVAAQIQEPLGFADGGSWPVAGSRQNLDGKFPGVLIRAERGTPVASIASGRVVYAGPHSTFGNVVFVQSAQGYIYVYGGQEAVAVGVGEEVAAGAMIGTVGVSPAEGAAALYFSVWRDNRFVDPESAPRG